MAVVAAQGDPSRTKSTRFQSSQIQIQHERPQRGTTSHPNMLEMPPKASVPTSSQSTSTNARRSKSDRVKTATDALGFEDEIARLRNQTKMNFKVLAWEAASVHKSEQRQGHHAAMRVESGKRNESDAAVTTHAQGTGDSVGRAKPNQKGIGGQNSRQADEERPRPPIRPMSKAEVPRAISSLDDHVPMPHMHTRLRSAEVADGIARKHTVPAKEGSNSGPGGAITPLMIYNLASNAIKVGVSDAFKLEPSHRHDDAHTTTDRPQPSPSKWESPVAYKHRIVSVNGNSRDNNTLVAVDDSRAKSDAGAGGDEHTRTHSDEQRETEESTSGHRHGDEMDDTVRQLDALVRFRESNYDECCSALGRWYELESAVAEERKAEKRRLQMPTEDKSYTVDSMLHAYPVHDTHATIGLCEEVATDAPVVTEKRVRVSIPRSVVLQPMPRPPLPAWPSKDTMSLRKHCSRGNEFGPSIGMRRAPQR
eukprot:Opistho-2@58580